MPVNRNALVRYKTIDKCLQNRYRKWTLDDLIEACSEALYEYEGIGKGVSKRSVQADIQIMRSDKLGYNAPIVVVDRKYYTYEDSEYSITNIPLTDQDLGKLTEVVAFLKQFQGFSHFRELDGMVQKLEDHVYSQKANQQSVIDFDKNDNLKGLEHLDTLYQAIIQQKCLSITYQSFNARQAQSFDFHPYLLKEYNNRWFLIGRQSKVERLYNLALDRIQDIQISSAAFRSDPDFLPHEYFKHNIGVTVNTGQKYERILLRFSNKHAPYVLTKPLHWTQEEVGRDQFGVEIALEVQHNFELEKAILSYGDGVTVLAPLRLKRIIEQRLQNALDFYQTTLSDSVLKSTALQLEHRGSSIIKRVYTRKEIQKIKSHLETYLEKSEQESYSIRRLLQKIPELQAILWNQNLQKIIRSIDAQAFCCKAIFFNKTAEANWSVNWHQDIPINVVKKKQVTGYHSWSQKAEVLSVCPPEAIALGRFSIRIHLDNTDANNGALKIIPGSQHQIHQPEAIELITQNSVPQVCEVPFGGVHLLKPMVLHTSSKVIASPKKKKQRRVIHLEFTSQSLSGGLEWAEKTAF